MNLEQFKLKATKVNFNGSHRQGTFYKYKGLTFGLGLSKLYGTEMNDYWDGTNPKNNFHISRSRFLEDIKNLT